MSIINRSFISAGSIHLQPYDQSAPLLPIGNVSEFTFSFEEDRKELKNYLGGGGNRNVLSRVSSVTAATTTPITDELLPNHGVEDELIPFNHLPDLKQSVTIKDSTDTELVTRILALFPMILPASVCRLMCCQTRALAEMG